MAGAMAAALRAVGSVEAVRAVAKEAGAMVVARAAEAMAVAREAGGGDGWGGTEGGGGKGVGREGGGCTGMGWGGGGAGEQCTHWLRATTQASPTPCRGDASPAIPPRSES